MPTGSPDAQARADSSERLIAEMENNLLRDMGVPPGSWQARHISRLADGEPVELDASQTKELIESFLYLHFPSDCIETGISNAKRDAPPPAKGYEQDALGKYMTLLLGCEYSLKLLNSMSQYVVTCLLKVLAVIEREQERYDRILDAAQSLRNTSNDIRRTLGLAAIPAIISTAAASTSTDSASAASAASAVAEQDLLHVVSRLSLDDVAEAKASLLQIATVIEARHKKIGFNEDIADEVLDLTKKEDLVAALEKHVKDYKTQYDQRHRVLMLLSARFQSVPDMIAARARSIADITRVHELETSTHERLSIMLVERDTPSAGMGGSKKASKKQKQAASRQTADSAALAAAQSEIKTLKASLADAMAAAETASSGTELMRAELHKAQSTATATLRDAEKAQTELDKAQSTLASVRAALKREQIAHTKTKQAHHALDVQHQSSVVELAAEKANASALH